MDERARKLGQIEAKINSLFQKVNKIQDDISIIKDCVVEVNLKVPRRQKGYLWNSWADEDQDEVIRNFSLKNK